jgi:hypothetical protein
MKKKTRKKVVRRKRRSMREKRVMQIKRGLIKRAKKLRLGAKRTGAYVYGTLRRIVGNPAIPANMNNPDYVRAYRRAQLISKLHNKRYSIYAFQLNGKWAFRVGSHRLSSQEQAVDVFDPKTLRENPYITKDGKRILYGYAKQDIAMLGTGLKIARGDLVLITPATNIPGGGIFVRPGYPTGIWKQVSEDDSIYIRPSDIKDDITYKKPVFGSKNWERMIRGNPMRSSFDKPTFGPMNTETRRVDTTTMAGMKEAERLQRAGWYQGPVTLFSSTYYRKRALPKSSIARQIRGNPPMYAHRMMSHRTHGLSLRQMMKLYRLVSSGNPKAVMFARRTLGIPMSESLSQVKAVVYHHVLDLKGKI